MLKDKIIQQLKTVFDPEIPVDVYELGLIYDIDIQDTNCFVTMTLTSAWCPEAQSIPVWVQQAVMKVEGIVYCDVTVTFEPPWTQECMSEVAKLEVGLL
jgi:FeS assembly SUF system protein|tara:strand:+ start:227 stop:523 length:297 start_codon:yes stop_codon:yes gene_type:complete